MKSILFTILLILPFFTFSQRNFKTPDYKKIEKQIINPKSRFYYPKLLERYQNSDTTLTPDDFYHLYYGFTCQPSYSPNNCEWKDSLIACLNRGWWNKYDTLIYFSRKVLEVNPFDLTALSMLSGSYNAKGMDSLYRKNEVKSINLFSIVSGSGDGKTEKTAWHVNTYNEEFDLIFTLGFQPVGERSIRNNYYHYFKVASNSQEIEGLYFNIKRLQEKETK